MKHQQAKTRAVECLVSERLLYRVSEAAALLAVSENTLYRDIGRGLIDAKRYGSQVRIHRDELVRIASVGMPADVLSRAAAATASA
jgi:excisionase family DNA binding protein